MSPQETRTRKHLNPVQGKERIARQALFATIGSIILLLPLIPEWSNTGAFGTTLAVIALILTPGLAFDGLIFGSMKRIPGSSIGFTLASGIAWYAAVTALTFTLGQPLNTVTISIITSITSMIMIFLMVITGKAFIVVKPDARDFKAVIQTAATLAAIGVVAASSWAVVSVLPVTQPEGKLLAMSLKDQNIDATNPYNVKANDNHIDLNVNSNYNTDSEMVVKIFDETTGKLVKHSNKVMTFKASNKTSTIPVEIPTFTGCGNMTVTYSDITLSNIFVKSSDKAKCETPAIINIFDKLGIDTSGAPTTSLKDLLKYLQTEQNKGNLNNLPVVYKNCISLDSSEQITECLNKIES